MKFKVGDVVIPLESAKSVYGITNHEVVKEIRVMRIDLDGWFIGKILTAHESHSYEIGNEYPDLEMRFFKLKSNIKLLSVKRIK